MTQPVKELQAYLETEAQSIRDDGDLISFKVSADGGLCKSVMRKLEAKYIGEHNLLGKWVSAGFGVKLPSGAFEYLGYGTFLVNELTITKDTGETNIVAYDRMINAMRPYTKLEIDYPVSLYVYTQKLCEACGLELGNTAFAVHNDWQIERELWENINGITYRDIFVQIAQATASTCIVGNDDKVYFKPITSTGGKLTYDNMFKLKIEDQYGEINSVVLARTPQEDNVYLRDDASVEVNGLTEFKIENNEILDKDRESAITPIYNALKGICYYPFEATTEGLGWYEIGDGFDIETDTGDILNTALFNFSVTIDGGIKETLKTVAETKTQTQYQYATTIAKRVKNAEIIVNKQDQLIQSLVSDMYEENGVVNEKYSKILQDVGNIILSVQNSGGNNLLKNSVMFAYDTNNIPADWILEGDGTLNIQSDVEALKKGGLSGHSFTLRGKIAKQTIPVKVSTDGERTAYTFSTKIKKDAIGSCYVRIYNDSGELYDSIEVPSGTAVDYADYEYKALLPKDNYYTIEFYGSPDSDATFTDNMFAVGEYKSQWTQANGEVMNTQVNINSQGILVKSNNMVDYTVMSPQEFAGYSKIGGKDTRVFSLNKGVTFAKKLEAMDEITMPPLKIVPVLTGDLQGWAFVPSMGNEINGPTVTLNITTTCWCSSNYTSISLYVNGEKQYTTPMNGTSSDDIVYSGTYSRVTSAYIVFEGGMSSTAFTEVNGVNVWGDTPAVGTRYDLLALNTKTIEIRTDFCY
jgi:hypothetical protein